MKLTNLQVDTWPAIFLSASIWSSFYLITRLIIRQKTPEYCSRIVAFTHGAIAAVVGLHQCFSDTNPFTHPEEVTTYTQSILLLVSLGYFIEDLIWCLYYQTESNLMVAHHIYCCIALARMLFKGFSGRQVTCGLGGMEVTNPLLQLRWFTRTHGYNNTPLFHSVELTFIIMFFFVRILVGTVISAMILLHSKNDTEFKVLALTLYMVSWMFMINICKYFFNKYMKNNINMNITVRQ